MAEAEGEAEADAAADPLGVAEPDADGDADGTAVGAGAGCRPMGSVLISMYPAPVRIAVASRSFSANTCTTSAGDTAGFSNLISQRVPPV